MKKIVLAATLTTYLLAGEGGDIFRSSVKVDTLEYQFNNAKTLSWSGYAYAGYDLNKFYFYSEGDKARKDLADSKNQVVYSHAVAPYWDIQMGLDYDKADTQNKTWGVIGFQGLAPYFFETRGIVLVGDDGNIGLRLDWEYEALITQKLIFTPSLALDAYTKDDPRMGIGSGLSNLTVGARIRYEFIREFAPYCGIEWSQNFGKTNDYHSLNEAYLTAGLRFWF